MTEPGHGEVQGSLEVIRATLWATESVLVWLDAFLSRVRSARRELGRVVSPHLEI